MTIAPMDKDPISYFSGYSISEYNKPSDSVLLKLARTGKLRDLFIAGPHRNSKIFSANESWKRLDAIRTKCLADKVFPILDHFENEGGTIWMLRIDDSLYSNEGIGFKPDFVSIMEKELHGKSFANSYTQSQGLMEGETKDPPFAIAAVLSVKYENPMPFFGKTMWGLALKEDVLSVTQVPTMLGNKQKCATWFYMCTELINDEDLISKFGKNGGENDYDRFLELRNYINKNCKPLNTSGKYDENRLLMAHKSSLNSAKELLVSDKEYMKLKNEEDSDNGSSISATRTEFPKGDPIQTKFSGKPAEVGPIW